MTKEQAQYVVEVINKLMAGKPCVSVSTGPSYKRNPEIRVNQVVQKAYIAHTKNGYDEPLSFSWALMDPASADWHEWYDVQRGMWGFPKATTQEGGTH